MRCFKSVAFLLLITVLLLTGCGSHSRKPAPVRDDLFTSKKVNLEAPNDIERKPWELWGLGRDLSGVSIHNEEIRKGDEAVRIGDYVSAIREYEGVDPTTLTEEDQKALIARKAGALLAVGRYTNGLDVLSRFFAQKGLTAEAVDGNFALILGFGYGALGDIDQSLAWFGRADGTVSNSPIFANTTEQGAKLLIQSIPDASFDTIYSKWKDDPRFGEYFQREKSLRGSPDYHAKQTALTGGPFWDRGLNTTQTAVTFDQSTSLQSSLNVGVILPLSGGFAPLGQGTKNGMDIAIEVEQEPRVNVIFKDSQGDTTIARNLAQEVIRTDKANVIVGPLLSEPANAVRQVALQTRVPQLSLSKGNVFETGDIIFRLGATSNSQMDTLLEACSQKLGMTKFALVYPENNVGLEYANAFKKYISAKGLELLYEGTYAPQDTSKLTLIASEIEKLPIEGIFFPDNLDQARSFFSLLPESYRDHVRPLGPATWDDPQALSQSQAIFKGATFVSPFFVGRGSPLVKRFIERYTQKVGKRPDFLAAQGFDAMTIVIGAARKTLSDGTPFELALKDVELYDGLTGSMRVDVSGEIQRAYVVVETRNGEIRALGSSRNEGSSGKENKEEIYPTQSTSN